MFPALLRDVLHCKWKPGMLSAAFKSTVPRRKRALEETRKVKPNPTDIVTPEFMYRYQDTMQYGIYAAKTGYVKDTAFEAARLGIMRSAKTKEISRIAADMGITKKPEGTRMGKGKGKVAYYAAYVKAGKVLMEFNCDNDIVARQAFKQATFKLPLKTHFRIRPVDSKKVVTCSEFLEICNNSK